MNERMMDKTFTQIKNTENSSHKQISGHSRSPGEESMGTNVNSRKRKRAVTVKDDRVSKRSRNEGSEFPNNLQDESRQELADELHNAYQTNQCRNQHPHRLIQLMYQLDLSVLCSLRKFTYEHKYPSLSLAFGDSEINKFNNIVLSYDNKSIYIQIENVEKCYTDNDISYDILFTKEKRNFSINNYLNSFVKHLFSKLDSSLNNIRYLIIYTNSGLDLTEEKKLKKGHSRNFYPFKFDSINIEECDILKDFLFTNNDTKMHNFHRFLRDGTTRKELLKRLEFTSAMKKVIKERKLSEEEVKDIFLDKLVFAVNQPNREELNRIVKNEIEGNSKVQDDYIELQEKILRDLTDPKKQRKIGNYIPGIVYEFNLLLFFLHDMFLRKNISYINSERKIGDISNDVTIRYKNKITYVKAHTTDSSIGYSQLFSSSQRNNTISVNKLFTLFVEEIKEDIKYFIIYTNADLDLTREKILKQRVCKDFHTLEFDSTDIRKYKILRNFSRTNENGLYKFAQEETTREKLLCLLKLPPSFQKKKERGRLSNESEREMKEKFLDKLIFAVEQPNRGELNSDIKNEIDQSNVPYNYEELHEIALRWSESHELGPITKGIMEKLLGDIKDNRSSYQEIQNRSIDEVMRFAQSVVGQRGTLASCHFADFLIKGEGSKCLEVLKRNGSILAHMSSILGGAGNNATKAFKDLYDLWFDGKGKRTQYLKTLEKERMNLVNMSGILGKSGAKAPEAFEDLYNLWFDKEGKKTQYLKILEQEEINLTNMSSILYGSKSNAAKAFEDLYNLWFDSEGKKTRYLKTLEKEGINLASMSSILNGTGYNATEAFKNLYDLWFNAEGKKTQYLKTLEEEGINLANMSSIIGGARANPAKTFKDLYNLWFDVEGKKTQYLITLKKAGINLANMSSILSGAGSKAPKAFEDLYILWFDVEGKKTQYLIALEKKGINLANMSSILSKAGPRAPEAFKDLHDLWFDAEGKKTQYLKTLEKEGINLANMTSILSGAGANATKAFKNLYDLWFDAKGKKTQYLKTLEEEGINTANISGMLGRTGAKAKDVFEDLHNLWFDKGGKKTQYLKTLEKEGINLANIISILYGARAKAPQTFKELYHTFFDEQGNKSQHLRHFTEQKDREKCFTLRNLSGILSRAGAHAKDAFEKLHDVCFNGKGKRTELLNDFCMEGFRPRNLSFMLRGTGARASSVLKRLHSDCFNQKGERTKLLDDFYKAGFRVCDLCNILSVAAVNLGTFHDFCFIGKTKKYLSHFLNQQETFTARNLSQILFGTGANICSALKNLHDVCFDETGNKTQILCDFHQAGFKPRDLSNILSRAGNNAASILNEFHKCCFNKKSYLDHFLAKKELFTPKNLSKVLDRLGTKICPTFEKLHDVCFDEAGKKTYYLNNLIESSPSNEILDILHEKVRKSPPTVLGDISL